MLWLVNRLDETVSIKIDKKQTELEV